MSAVTDGEIAAINLESARRRAWSRFRHDTSVAEQLLDMERLKSQFLGDLYALDRMEALASQFSARDSTYRAALVRAEVASTVHHFADARTYLVEAARLGAPPEEIERLRLTIDQACGTALDDVVATRRRRPGDAVPLGAVLADLERFDEADDVYREAYRTYDGLSPFPLAWACFQLGQLWGELVPEPEPDRAAIWYRRAIAIVPFYVKARVHLAEICEVSEAEALLRPALSSSDPEVSWRLSGVLAAQDWHEESKMYLDAARHGFETLLAKHPLAFADHGAEFYAGSGGDHSWALQLARSNAANRTTHRAVRQVRAIAANVGGTSEPAST